jgi:hypothetical protein
MLVINNCDVMANSNKTNFNFSFQTGFGPDQYIPVKELSAIMKILPTLQVNFCSL